MKLLNNSKFKGLPLATLFLICISLVWQSPAQAEKPVLDDPFFPGGTPVFTDDGDDTVFTAGEGLYLKGYEKIKLSKCDKPPKVGISVHLAFPESEVIHIVAINDELFGTYEDSGELDDAGTPLIDESIEFVPAPIVGSYSSKNRVWLNVNFGNGPGNGNGNGNGGNVRNEGSGFDILMSRFEDSLEGYCEGEVNLTTKKTKFRLKVQEKDDGFKSFLFLDAKLRRNGNANEGAGVAQIKAKGKPGLFVDAEAPAAPAPPAPPAP